MVSFTDGAAPFKAANQCTSIGKYKRVKRSAQQHLTHVFYAGVRLTFTGVHNFQCHDLLACIRIANT